MTAKKRKTAANKNASAEITSEINAPRWSIVSFEKVEAKNLIYAEAGEKINQLEARKVSGLCIVTDEAAGRISKLD